ncbi:hypothetical protein ACRE_076750 [Hapsidospora chrysogenum ATCC 11550]|uniref:Uncharacterized protein n=1 Tax=Hapsidospora chrysogenum (strain ATCC 11550 / CBS 779.69 / DSM 880 / IAM 14645 / JCM 23072 / IMI 49137) TaxID=857340 RepID=A0A086SWX8_HAPC1|nr:hypothetical protein ACRE_076750 [Hapsidospora chrysogenum ATCC 11550]
MSTDPQALAGADRIRSLKDEDAIFQAFDSYPWRKDKAFMSGLYAILGNPADNNPQASLLDMATHARVFYYAQKIGVSIDFARYQSWLAAHPDHQAPDVLPDEYHVSATRSPAAPQQQQSQQPALDWQKAAPKADLYVEKKAAGAGAAGAQGGGADGDQPSYPMGFAEMIKLLQEGKPVPGIRQIPNTVVRDPSVKPVGSRPVPRKPWEKADVPQTADLDITKALDSEFPPVESEAESAPQPTAA